MDDEKGNLLSGCIRNLRHVSCLDHAHFPKMNMIGTVWAGTDRCYIERFLGSLCHLIFVIREDIKEKNVFIWGIARMRGGVYPCPNFLALYQEVHFLSIKRVYFFKNANVLNF